jgi:hypothetical protein
MALSPDLFRSVNPPGVWITLGQLEVAEAESITVVVRLKEGNQRSVSATAHCSRYCPTDQILFAVAYAVKRLSAAQAHITAAVLLDAVESSLIEYVDPF